MTCNFNRSSFISFIPYKPTADSTREIKNTHPRQAKLDGRSFRKYFDDSLDDPKPTKKVKKLYQMVCDWCGPNPVQTSERRAGPKGPQTLCNACGQRYAKSERKEAVKKAKEEQKVYAKMQISLLLN